MKELKVVFEGEEGVDEGGVRKEFFQLLIAQLFGDEFGMFQPAGPNQTVRWFNPGCEWSDDEYYLIGQVLALAVYNSVVLDVHFPSVLYKKLLPHQRFSLRDVASLDPDLAKGLKQLLDYPPDQVKFVCVCVCVRARARGLATVK